MNHECCCVASKLEMRDWKQNACYMFSFSDLQPVFLALKLLASYCGKVGLRFVESKIRRFLPEGVHQTTKRLLDCLRASWLSYLEDGLPGLVSHETAIWKGNNGITLPFPLQKKRSINLSHWPQFLQARTFSANNLGGTIQQKGYPSSRYPPGICWCHVFVGDTEDAASPWNTGSFGVTSGLGCSSFLAPTNCSFHCRCDIRRCRWW